MLSNIIESIIISDPKSQSLFSYGVGCNGLSKVIPTNEELRFVKNRLLPLIAEKKSLLVQYHMRGFDSEIYYFSTVVFDYNLIFVIMKENFLRAQTSLPTLYYQITQTKHNNSIEEFVDNLKNKIFKTNIKNCRSCDQACVPSFLLGESDIIFEAKKNIQSVSKETNLKI